MRADKIPIKPHKEAHKNFPKQTVKSPTSDQDLSRNYQLQLCMIARTRDELSCFGPGTASPRTYPSRTSATEDSDCAPHSGPPHSPC
ncbi:hypothetical protein SMICM304S_12162 [Streptomyces microflavus]